MCQHSNEDHHDLCDRRWEELEWVAFQPVHDVTDPNDAEEWLELANVPMPCGSTLARPVPPERYGSARAWWAAHTAARSQ